MNAPADSRLLILDFGSQLTQLIARRLREAGVYCEIFPPTAGMDRIEAFAPQGLILSGGPAGVGDAGAPMADPAIYQLGLPILGICYGQMLLVHQLGGAAEPGGIREFGRAEVEITGQSALLAGVWHQGSRQVVWMSHGDRVSRLPPGFAAVGCSEGAPFAVLADEQRRFFGVMFHPEVVHTPQGAQLLSNFASLCGCSGRWTMAAFRGASLASIREQVGGGRVICGLSGGVDSSVAAMIIHEAIGSQLTCIFVDHGLLREGEAAQVVSTFRDRFNVPLVHRDAADLFVGQLAGITDPGTEAQNHRPAVYRGV